jgi:hypothetical protein
MNETLLRCRLEPWMEPQLVCHMSPIIRQCAMPWRSMDLNWNGTVRCREEYLRQVSQGAITIDVLEPWQAGESMSLSYPD